MVKVKSDTWGWLEASDVKVEGPLVRMLDVARDGKPFHAECLIPVIDVKIIIPSE
jgi:hypothetical protein